jgi:hypothetical protein
MLQKYFFIFSSLLLTVDQVKIIFTRIKINKNSYFTFKISKGEFLLLTVGQVKIIFTRIEINRESHLLSNGASYLFDDM